MDLKKIKTYVLDVDGTLYSKHKMRMVMAIRLVIYCFKKPSRIKELYAILVFRRLREQEKWKSAGFRDLCYEVSGKVSLSAGTVAKTIRHWMFKAPLDILKKTAFRDVVSFIDNEHHTGKRIIIYSDYPAVAKLQAIGMPYDTVFSFGHNGIDEQKPSRNVMKNILSAAGCSCEHILYVGDRDDRDRISAEMAGILYCDIRKFRKIIAVS